MRCSVNADPGSEHSSVTNLHKTTVEDAAVEVCVEALPDFDVASVVHLLHINIVSMRSASEDRL